MRTLRWATILLWMCGICAAQMPPREELTGTPKYLEDVPRSFQTFSEAQLRAQTVVASARSHAVFGYNTPEVRITLPHSSNSSYSQTDFTDPVLVNAGGAKVAYELERGGYEESKFSDEVRFRRKGSDALISFAHVKGSVKLKYPLEVKTLVFTPAQTGAKEFGVKIDGPYVSYAAEAVHLPETSFSKLKPLRAYDAAGHLLDQYSVTETVTGDDGNESAQTAFHGNVARLEIDSVERWAEFEIPYNLTPAPMLPAGHEGDDPESYK